MKIHEGNRYIQPGVLWTKACDCRSVTATIGEIHLRATPKGDQVEVAAVYQPGPVCDRCGEAWKKEEAPNEVLWLDDHPIT